MERQGVAKERERTDEKEESPEKRRRRRRRGWLEKRRSCTQPIERLWEEKEQARKGGARKGGGLDSRGSDITMSWPRPYPRTDCEGSDWLVLFNWLYVVATGSSDGTTSCPTSCSRLVGSLLH